MDEIVDEANPVSGRDGPDFMLAVRVEAAKATSDTLSEARQV
jgi:hypothetical protein